MLVLWGSRPLASLQSVSGWSRVMGAVDGPVHPSNDVWGPRGAERCDAGNAAMNLQSARCLLLHFA